MRVLSLIAVAGLVWNTKCFFDNYDQQQFLTYMDTYAVATGLPSSADSAKRYMGQYVTPNDLACVQYRDTKRQGMFQGYLNSLSPYRPPMPPQQVSPSASME